MLETTINILPDDEKLQLASKLYTQLQIPSIEEEDIFQLMNKHTFKTESSVEKGVRAMAYIRLRDFEGYTRIDAYKKVYSDRWKRTDSDKDVLARARRIEFTDVYKKMIVEMQMNFYGIFAIERVHAINDSLKRAYDRDVSEKYNFEYMKLFLESTKQPDEMKSKIDVNIMQDGASIKDVEKRLSDIADKLDGASGSDIMDAVLLGSEDDN